MAEKKEKKSKEEKLAKKERKEKKRSREAENASAETATFSLLADNQALNPALSSLFAAKPTPPQRNIHQPEPEIDQDSDDADEDAVDGAVDADAELSELEDEELSDGEVEADPEPVVLKGKPDEGSKRKRKRKDADEGLEDAYMRRLAKEEEREAEKNRAAKRMKDKDGKAAVAGLKGEEDDDDEDEEVEDDDDEDMEDVDDDDILDAEEAEGDRAASPPPKHETLTGDATDTDAAKAARTVFIGNVSTQAIASKSARKTLLSHLASFFPALPAPKEGEPKHAVESIRFRSTPYATKIPKKAAFARKEVMDATAHSTNAYAVYSTPLLAREAAKRLNGKMVLERHLRIDSVAHPAKIDNRRCVFVGNLGFVDDESKILAADAEAGHGNRKSKPASDVEEGLWRFFGKCGKVESVRVVRDEKTRVGKGFAYVQFTTEEGVELSLMKDGEKEPPMLPRKLRIMRAKAMKRNAKPASGRPGSNRPPAGGNQYQRKVTGEEASQIGRAGKLYGRAAAAQIRNPNRTPVERRERQPREEGSKLGDGIRKPETFVFEGQRATVGKKPSLKLGKKVKAKVGKPTNRGAKRAAAFKAAGGKKK